jgi:hypothetical protein
MTLVTIKSFFQVVSSISTMPYHTNFHKEIFDRVKGVPILVLLVQSCLDTADIFGWQISENKKFCLKGCFLQFHPK